jgi:hypothetical protein
MRISRAHQTELGNTKLLLFIVLFYCETLPLTLREEHKLRVLENMTLKAKVVSTYKGKYSRSVDKYA